jgi:hypothetical protein
MYIMMKILPKEPDYLTAFEILMFIQPIINILYIVTIVAYAI